MPFDEKNNYVKPVPRADRLMEHLKKEFPDDTANFQKIMEETIDWLCSEIDSLEQSLDFMRDTKADKVERKYYRNKLPVHFRGVRD